MKLTERQSLFAARLPDLTAGLRGGQPGHPRPLEGDRSRV